MHTRPKFTARLLFSRRGSCLRAGRACALAAMGVAATGAGAQTVTTTLPVTLDRWNYPFGDASGTRSTLPTYTALGAGAGFDDRDAEVLVGFATSPTVATGPASQYTINAAAVVVYVAMEEGQPSFTYDPTYDAAATYVVGTTTLDTDPGRPVELFGAGYRAGWTSLTFAENSPFATNPPVVSPARGNRNVYPIDFGGPGATARDVSNNITDFSGNPQPFDVLPFAIGIATGVAPSNFAPPLAAPPAPGQPVPNRTQMRFDLDLNVTGVRQYLADGLSVGRLNFILDSLAPATAFGSGPVTYPIFFSKENALGRGATLELSVTIGGGAGCNRADITEVGGTSESPGAPDGQLTVDDLVLFVNLFSDSSGCPGAVPCSRADITGVGAGAEPPDGQLTVDDLIEFVNAFSTGC